MLADRIEKCVRCDYSFVGLPLQTGACPECGLGYDECSRIFQVVPGKLDKRMIALSYVGFLPLILIQGIQSWNAFGILGIVGVLLVVGLIVGVVIVLWKFYQRRARSILPWIGCFREGFMLRDGVHLKPQFYAWSGFTGCRVTGRHSSFGAAFRFRAEKSGIAASNELNVQGVFGSRGELEDFVALVDLYLVK